MNREKEVFTQEPLAKGVQGIQDSRAEELEERGVRENGEGLKEGKRQRSTNCRLESRVGAIRNQNKEPCKW